MRVGGLSECYQSASPAVQPLGFPRLGAVADLDLFRWRARPRRFAVLPRRRGRETIRVMAIEADVWDCISAREFFDALQPEQEIWEMGQFNRWVFRGHGNADWRLVPSAWRRSAWPNAIQSWVRQTAFYSRSWPRHEHHILSLFFRSADMQGLPIPNDSVSLRRDWFDERQPRHGDSDPWPEERLLPALALAQHHGLPTRLLDWTYSSLVAAYFAVMQSVAEDAKRIAVVALDTGEMSLPQGENDENSFQVIHVPGGGHKNLTAQRGLFTVTTSAFGSRERERAALEDLAHEGSGNVAWLRKLTLPIEHSGELLTLLARANVDGGALFPGFDGAARRTREAIALSGVPTPRVPKPAGVSAGAGRLLPTAIGPRRAGFRYTGES